jgi:hypothetical protein
MHTVALRLHAVLRASLPCPSLPWGWLDPRDPGWPPSAVLYHHVLLGVSAALEHGQLDFAAVAPLIGRAPQLFGKGFREFTAPRVLTRSRNTNVSRCRPGGDPCTWRVMSDCFGRPFGHPRA